LVGLTINNAVLLSYKRKGEIFLSCIEERKKIGVEGKDIEEKKGKGSLEVRFSNKNDTFCSCCFCISFGDNFNSENNQNEITSLSLA
jgi:hypothetical protein